MKKFFVLILCAVFVSTSAFAGSEGRMNTAIGIAAVLGTASVLNQIINPQPTVVVTSPSVVYAPVEEVYIEPAVSTTYVVPVHDYGFTPAFRSVYYRSNYRYYSAPRHHNSGRSHYSAPRHHDSGRSRNRNNGRRNR